MLFVIILNIKNYKKNPSLKVPVVNIRKNLINFYVTVVKQFNILTLI